MAGHRRRGGGRVRVARARSRHPMGRGGHRRRVEDVFGRRSGRYAVFVTGPMDLAASRLGPLDGLVEICNGMPWLSPLWSRLPRVVFLHHVHGEMWSMALPSPLAGAGNLLESRLAPPFYRRSQIEIG